MSDDFGGASNEDNFGIPLCDKELTKKMCFYKTKFYKHKAGEKNEKKIGTMVGFFLVLAFVVVGCRIPSEQQVASYQGLGIKVERIETQLTNGTRHAFFCFFADHTQNASVTMEQYKVFFGRDDREVVAESAWKPRRRNISRGFGHCPPVELFPSGMKYGWVSVVVTGLDANGNKVLGYNQVYVQKGQLEREGDRVNFAF